MPRKKKRNGRKQEPTCHASDASIRRVPWIKAIAAVLGVTAAAVAAHYLLQWDRAGVLTRTSRAPVERVTAGSGRADGAPANSATPASAERKTVAQNGESSQAGFDVLEGRWRRSDGSYVIHVRNVDADGTMEAAYYNPNPIHVSKAKATQEGETTKVFIELRDVKYPGCTYRLDYQPENDRLVGVYHQTAIRQQFEVIFLRLRR